MIQSLPSGIGNNAFSLDRKPDRNPLQVTPLKQGSFDELKVGTHVAFQDFDGERWMECVGLESALLCTDYPVPIYVFDNHNQAFYGWAEGRKNAKFKMKNEKYPGEYWYWSDDMVLVHLDAHYDDREPPSYDVRIDDLDDVQRYTNQVLQIATFIQPALKLGIFSEVRNYVESGDFEQNAKCEIQNAKMNIVLDIDLDVFCEEMSHVSFQEKIRVIREYLPFTKLITMATSPFFIDQEKAIGYAKRIVAELFG